MKISCLMPTYNRFSLGLGYLVEEAVESFLRQDYPDKELIICNDTPGHFLSFDHPQVKIFNLQERFKTLSDKIQFMIDQAQGDALCRWDDDDISLPHRLQYSALKLEFGDCLEWRASNYWYDCGHLREVNGAGNTHVQSLWMRSILSRMGGYPQGLTGNEDQAFNRMLEEMQMTGMSKVEQIAPEEIYYLYRWCTGSYHLSGKADNSENPHQAHWDEIGEKPIARGTYEIKPRWYRNHCARVGQALRMAKEPKDPLTIQNYFNYQAFYDWAVTQMPPRAKMVEVGCLSGASTCYLANKARQREIRIEVIAVDQGVGVNPKALKEDYIDTAGLLQNIRECGCQDMITLIAGESTKAAHLLPDRSINFLFLDAGHEFDDIMSDLQAWEPKVIPGGIIAGHDYMGCGHPDVHKAVDRFFGVPKFSLAAPQTDTVWVYRKGR